MIEQHEHRLGDITLPLKHHVSRETGGHEQGGANAQHSEEKNVSQSGKGESGGEVLTLNNPAREIAG